MAKKKDKKIKESKRELRRIENEKNDRDEKFNLISSLRKETIEGIVAIVFIVISIFLILSPFGKAGLVGNFIFKIFDQLLGVGYYLVPLTLTTLGIYYIKSTERHMTWLRSFGALLFVLSGIGLIDLVFKNGGIVGHFMATPLVRLFDFWVTLVILISLLVISALIIFDAALNISRMIVMFKKSTDDEDEDADEKLAVENSHLSISVGGEKIDDSKNAPIKTETKKEKEDDDVSVKIADNTEKRSDKGKSSGLVFFSTKINKRSPYQTPPINIFDKDSGKPGVGDIKANANIIKRTLMNFGISVEMDEVSVGPSVTRYALKPAEGVKLSRIVALQNDLALALAAHPLRIEAPIPGKSLVGIEIPNTTKTRVGLGTMFQQEEFENSEKPLLLGMGKGVTGKSYFTNLAKAPHMLIAGATGSGKSVTIHALVASLLYRNSPEMLKFIMVDPKRVELTLYNKIPHLLTPVITDPKKTILALKWAGKEMNRRYDVLQEKGVRDIESYHKNVLEPAMSEVERSGDLDAELPETMPFIVIIIDELADIMQTYPRELEAGIVRLAQMSRAVGIHLIISTQRPSVNVITGLIKANIPTRVALQVASQIDSRTILDMPGAEKLLGQGDMLFLGAERSQPVRVQSAFISEDEVKKLVEFLSKQYEDDLPESNIDLEGVNDRNTIFDAMDGSDESDDDEDDLYSEAKAVVMEAGKASTSYLQRKLGIGYSRAAKIIDILESKGVIGPANGSKPREILVGDDEKSSAGSSNVGSGIGTMDSTDAENFADEILDEEDILNEDE